MVKLTPTVSLVLCLGLSACENPTAPERSPTVGLDTGDAPEALVNSWATFSPLPTTRTFAVAGAQNNIIYFVGGDNSAGQATKTLLAYTVATNSWTFKTSMPVNRTAANGASFLNGRLYVSGGISNTGGAARTLYEYNPATDTGPRRATCRRHRPVGRRG